MTYSGQEVQMKGKFHQTSGGSLRKSQRRAERAARRSQKRQSERQWRREEKF